MDEHAAHDLSHAGTFRCATEERAASFIAMSGEPSLAFQATHRARMT
eukprot:SAG31_NODE_41344_length_276_cov_1.146893_1_plen_46_part_10